MREVRVLTWCDMHDDKETPGTERKMFHPLTGKPVKPDLCDACDKNVRAQLADVTEMLDRIRRKPAAPKKRVPAPLPGAGSDGYPCPDQSCPKATGPRFPFRSMVQHVRQNHKDIYEAWKAEQDRIRAGQEQLPEAI